MKTFCIITCLLLLVLSQQVVYAQQPLAQQAFAVFEQHCLDCHGEFGSYSDVLTIKHKDLIEDRSIIPGQPDASELYLRLLGDTDSGSQMPLGQDPLDPDAIATIRRWIEAGAPDWEAIPKPKRRFITTEAMLEAIHTHVTSLTAFDRSFARYFTLTHLYNAGASDDNLRAYRNALSKLVNSLSWGAEVIKPTPIDREETIFYIDLRHYEWDVKSDKWYKIEQAYPYGVQLKSSTYTTLCQETDCELPFVRADWFIATASLPPLYHEILDLPETDRALETRLEVDVAENLKNAPGVRVWRAGFNESGVSINNRVVERHKSRYGAYWKSYDFAGNVGTQNIFTHPLNFTHDGGEIIFNLPNGLQAYYLSTAIGERLDAAPINIVSNAGARDPVVRNGLSCMGCHTEGMKTFEDQVRSVIEQNLNPSYDKAQALRLYVEKSKMDSLIRGDITRYRRAIEAAGGVFGGSEPIQQLVKQFEGPLDATHAAAEVGLKTDEFLQKIRENSTLQNAGLLVLGVENGSVKRDAWESQFGTIIYALHLGKHAGTYSNMVLIPAGEFQMGSNDGGDTEKPVHTVYTDAFYIDKYEVTISQYKKFLDANPQLQKDDNYRLQNTGEGNLPVTPVSWYAAMAYAQWAGKRLPTEAEWEKAARGGLVGQAYPWGNSIDSSKVFLNGGMGNSVPVGSYPPNNYGLYDMAGNAWEWCLDEYDPDFYSKSQRRNPIAGADNIDEIINNFRNIKTSRVLRGATSVYSKDWMRISVRGGRLPTDAGGGGDESYTYGFRCVKDGTPNLGKHNNELSPARTPLVEKNTVNVPKETSTSSSKIASENMVLIPAGEFQMGSNNGDDDEKPVHTVYVDAFYIDKYEVTVGEYKEFVQATGHRAPDWNKVSQYSPTDQYSIVFVSWHNTMTYAQWAGKRLPTEAEWEKAARGGLIGATYSWGNQTPNGALGNIDSTADGYKYAAPVGSFPANGYGLHDTAGNVWEWVLDVSEFYSISPSRNPVAGSESIRHLINNLSSVGGFRVLRGGSWSNTASHVRVANRSNSNLTDTDPNVGFRCATSVKP